MAETARFRRTIRNIPDDLSESEKRLRSIFKAAPIGIGVVSDRVLTEVNSQICEMIGYTEEELVGSSSRILYPSDSEFEYVGSEKYRQIAENGTGTVETKWMKKDRNIIDILLSSTPIDVNNLKLGVTFTALDITERIANEKKIADEAKRWEALITQSKDGIVILDKMGGVYDANQSYANMIGYSLEEVKQLHVWDWDAKLSRDKLEKMILSVGKNGIDLETIHRRKDGTTFDVAISSSSIHYENKNLVLCVCTDISERKKAEYTLRESEEKFRTLISGMQQGLAVHEIIFNDKGKVADYRFLDVNDSFEKITGLKKEDIIGRTVLEVLPNTEDYWIEKYGHVATTGEPLFYENYSSELDRYYEVVAYRPRPGQFATIITDVTERKKAEKVHKLQAERDKAIIDTLPDMLLVFDREGYCREFYIGEESKPVNPIGDVVGSNIKDAFPAEEASRYIQICNECIDSGKMKSVEYQISKNGKISFFEARVSPLNENNVLAIIRDITESKNYRDTLTTITETGFEHGDNIFRILVRQLAVSQSVNTAFLAEFCQEEEKASTVAVWNHGNYVQNFGFDTKGTLCENVLLSGEWFCPSNVQQLYPESQVLKRLGAESYWGLALRNDSNENIGVLVIIDDKPMEHSAHLYSILSSFAARAAAEIERRKAEEALKENERKFRSYVDNSPSAIIVADNTGQYIDVNPAASRITGFSREELLSMNQKDTFPPEEKYNYEKLFQELHENGHLSVELPFLKKDGTRGYWAVDIVRLSEELFLGVHTDISDRINAEEMLGSATYRLSLATKSAEIGIWEWDFKANSLIWDKKMHDIYGTDPGEFTGEFRHWEEKVHPDDSKMVSRELNDAVSGIKDFKTEFRILTPNNEVRFLEAHAMVIRDPDGNPLKAIGTNWDITERKVAEEALIYSKIISEDTNRIKSEFMKNMSHELRTPLTAVIGFADVLLKQDSQGLSKAQKTYAEYIYTSGNNLLDLINKILDFSKYEINDLENLNLKKVTLDSLVNEIIMLIAKKAADRSISLSFKRKESIGTFYADEHKLTQIIHNLLENAVKFTEPGGSVTIETSTYGRMLRISVIDTGIGICNEDLNNIFKPFHQIDGSIGRKYSGTGIGLALTKKFVELHGGTIKVTSEPGKGSNFTFEIPIDPYLAD
nr:PAS domain S-box protein [uncultured Methanolobus sp.]